MKKSQVGLAANGNKPANKNIVAKIELAKPKPKPIAKLALKQQPAKPLKSLIPNMKPPSLGEHVSKVHDEKVEIRQASKGLEKHMEGSRKSKKGKKVEGSLSPYAKCMLSPFEYSAAQIPDANTFPSACGQLTQKFIIKPQQCVNEGESPVGNLGQSFAICIGSSFTNEKNPSFTNAYTGGNIVPSMIINGTTGSTSSDLRTWGCYGTGIVDEILLGESYIFLPSFGDTTTGIQNPVIPLTNPSFGDHFSDGFVSSIDLIRPVSCAVKATAIGPALTKQGYFVGASFPRTGIMDAAHYATANFNKILNHPSASLIPVVDGCLQVNYSPTDNVNYEYLDPTKLFTSNNTAWEKNRGELWLCGVGLQEDESILVEVTMGFEFIPKSSVLDIVDVTPSFVHTNEMDQAENLAAVTPKVMEAEISDISSFVAPDQGLGAVLSNSSIGLKNNKNIMKNSYLVHLKSSEHGNKVSNFLSDVTHTLKTGKGTVKEAKSLLSEILSSVMGFAKEF